MLLSHGLLLDLDEAGLQQRQVENFRHLQSSELVTDDEDKQT